MTEGKFGEVEITADAVHSYLGLTLGYDRIAAFTYELEAKLLKALGFRNFQQVQDCIRNLDESLRPHVQRDDADSCRGSENLDGQVAEPADPDDNAGCAGNQRIAAELDRMIRRESSICQRRCLRYIQVAD